MALGHLHCATDWFCQQFAFVFFKHITQVIQCVHRPSGPSSEKAFMANTQDGALHQAIRWSHR